MYFMLPSFLAGMEEQVRATEARVQPGAGSLLTERAQLAEKRLEVAEKARLEVINQADRKLQDASKVFNYAEARIAAAEEEVTALEIRAQSAGALLCEARPGDR